MCLYVTNIRLQACVYVRMRVRAHIYACMRARDP